MIETFYPSEIVQVDSLKPYPRNYNVHDERQLGHLADSLSQFGQFKNILVWRDYIIAGHGLVAAAKARGWTTLEVKRLPGDWDEARVQAVLVADNEIARRAQTDSSVLSGLLREIERADPALISAVGFTPEDLAALLDATGPIYAPELNPEFSHENVTEKDIVRAQERLGTQFDLKPKPKIEVLCPHCGEQFYVDAP